MKDAILSAYDCFELEHPEDSITEEQLTQLLSNYLNDLIHKNQNKVVQLLYQIDVDEHKVKQALSDTTSRKSIGERLAVLIIERQKLKLHYRKKFS